MSWRTSFPSAIPVSNPSGGPPNTSTCKTGCSDINVLFYDGLPSNSILELVGESGAGKTQLCLSSAVASASMGHHVLYIDSCNGVVCTRLEELVAARKNSTVVGGSTALSRKSSLSGTLRDSYCSDVLSRISIERARDPWTLLTILTAAAECHVNACARRSMGSNKRARRSSSASASSNSSSVMHSMQSTHHTSYDLIVIDCLHTLIAPYAGLSTGSSSGGGGSSTGSGISIDALITNLGLLCRQLATLGCTILLTNVPSTTTFSSSSSGGSFGGNVKTTQEGSLSFPHGAMSAPLSDLFDAILTVTATPIIASSDPSGTGNNVIGVNGTTNNNNNNNNNNDTMLRVEVLLRPPYYCAQPSFAEVRISQLCTEAAR